MNDRWLRAGTVLAVLTVAGIAAVISYEHLYHIAVTHGETRLDSMLIPLSIDGTVVTASMLMLRAARAGHPVPALVRLMLVAAIAMTVAANVAFGWSFAAWGVAMAGWPAAAFLANAEASIMFGRRAPSGQRGTVSAPAYTDAESAAMEALVRSVNGGNPLSANQLQSQYRLTRAEASKVRTAVLAASNGHGES